MIEKLRKTVLMLDHEPMLIDRRIVLEAQSLVNAGWRVILATRGDGIKPSFEVERGMEVHRFTDQIDEWLLAQRSSDGAAEVNNRQFRLAKARQHIHGWIQSAENPELKNKIKNQGLSDNFSLFVYAIAWPPAAASIVRRRFPWLKKIFNRAFEPLIYILLARPLFVVPYVRLLIDRILHYEFSSQIHPSVENSETWSGKLYKFAMEVKPDIIHAHDLPNLQMGTWLAERLQAILVYDAHELYPKQYFSDQDRRIMLLEMERRLIVDADAVISVNRQCADILENEYPIEPVIPLTNATESPEGFDPSKRQRKWHENFCLDQNIRIMVFQGGINPVRNVDPLIEALVGTPDNIHIGFITYGKDIPYYQELTQRLGVHHRVHYIVEIPWDEVNDWLASADVGVMPYQVTNYNAKISSPNKLYEFVVAGLPIIASTELDNVKAAIEEDGLGVMTLLRGVDTYRHVIMEMFDHPDGPERFRSNVLAARHKYMWSNEEPKLLALYERFRRFSFVPKSNRKILINNVKSESVVCAE